MLYSVPDRAPVVNAKSIRTADFSVELQRSGPAALPAVYKNFNLVTVFLRDNSLVGRRGSGGWTWTRFAAGESAIRAAGPGERVSWPEGVDCLHVHLHPRLIRRLGEAVHGCTPLAVETRRRLRDPVIRDIGLQLSHVILLPLIDVHLACELATAMAHHVTRLYPVDAPPIVRIGGLPVEEVLDGVRDSVGRWRGVPWLAARAGLTRSHFSRRFRSLVGLAPYSMVRSSRVEAAKHLLEQPSISLSEVAYRVGFADQSHFTRDFRRATAMTPARYRANRLAARQP